MPYRIWAVDAREELAPNWLVQGIEAQGRDTPRKIGWGCAALLPKTLTLFMTKICDIPYSVYDLTKNSRPLFMT